MLGNETIRPDDDPRATTRAADMAAFDSLAPPIRVKRDGTADLRFRPATRRQPFVVRAVAAGGVVVQHGAGSLVRIELRPAG